VTMEFLRKVSIFSELPHIRQHIYAENLTVVQLFETFQNTGVLTVSISF